MRISAILNILSSKHCGISHTKPVKKKSSAMRSMWASNGTSMIELVLYATLLTIFAAGAIDLITGAYAIMAKTRLQRIVNTEGELVMQRIIRELRNAYDIDTANSTFNTTPGALRIQTYADASGSATTTTDFRMIAGVLHMNKATTSIDLTSSASVSSLIFKNLNPLSTPKSIKIELTLIATSSRFTITSPFYGTVTLRGSYDNSN